MYNIYTSDQGFFFLEMQFGGGKLFLWGEKGPEKKNTASDSSKLRVTMLNYYVGCKPQKATKNTINSDSGLSLSAFQS